MTQIQDEFLIFLAWSVFTIFGLYINHITPARGRALTLWISFFMIWGGILSMFYLLIRLSINFY